MIIPSFGEIDKIAKSRYSLVMLVSGRARELVAGDEPLIDTDLNKPVSVAMEETMEGAVTFAGEEEAESLEQKKNDEKFIESERRRLTALVTDMANKTESKDNVEK